MTTMDLATGLAHLADVLDEVVEAAEPLVLAVVPLDGSPAMAELVQEARYRAKLEATPLINAYSSASLLGYAVVDSVRAFSALLRAPVIPVWAPLVNARAGVEAAAQMFWLVEPGLRVEARVQRGMVMRLHNARQQQRAPADFVEAHERARAAVDDIAEQADRLGWTISGRKQQQARVGSEVQPKSRDAIHDVLRFHEDVDTEAAVTWWFYSGVMHANPFAFMQFIGREETRPSGVAGLRSAPIMVSGRQFVFAGTTLGRAAINATTEHARLLGTDATGLQQAERSFYRNFHGALQAMERSDPISSTSSIG